VLDVTSAELKAEAAARHLHPDDSESKLNPGSGPPRAEADAEAEAVTGAGPDVDMDDGPPTASGALHAGALHAGTGSSVEALKPIKEDKSKTGASHGGGGADADADAWAGAGAGAEGTSGLGPDELRAARRRYDARVRVRHVSGAAMAAPVPQDALAAELKRAGCNERGHILDSESLA